MHKRLKDLCKDESNQFYRQLGWKKGVSGQTKFRLGSDLPRAEIAYQRLGLLWDLVVKEHEQRPPTFADMSLVAGQLNRIFWSEESLVIAEAIRKHLTVVKIGSREQLNGASAYVTYLDYLQQRYGHLIHVVPADVQAAELGKAAHRQLAEHRSRKARLSARIADIPIPAGLSGTTLYQAVDAYASLVQSRGEKESHKVEAATARRLKNSTHDMDLSEFGYSAMERIRTYWTGRPMAKSRDGMATKKLISLTTVDNHLSTARRFVRWLDRADEYQWELPRHGLEALSADLRRFKTDEEIAQQRHGVKVFSIEHLILIYRYATDIERLMLLLGLNAGMSHAEITSLRWDEIEPAPPTIKRIRRKSEVYGEVRLWPETVSAIEWWRAVRPPVGDTTFMVTDAKRPVERRLIANTWRKIRERIERKTDSKATWWLSFKYLRKTAAQLVRNASDGEIAGIFLSHGQPVSTDDLADVYSRRPFAKVAEALCSVHKQLSPMFEAAPDAFKRKSIGRW